MFHSKAEAIGMFDLDAENARVERAAAPAMAATPQGAGALPIRFVCDAREEAFAHQLARQIGSQGQFSMGGQSLRAIAQQRQSEKPLAGEPISLVVVLHCADSQETLENAIAFAESMRGQAFVAFVADDVSAVDYRRLLNTNAGEWIPRESAQEDILRLVTRLRDLCTTKRPHTQCLFTSFISGGGGAGASTLAVETAVYLAKLNRCAEPRICIVDLNFQQGNVSDLLDVAPLLELKALRVDPERIDDQLLTAFRSRSEHGVDVFAPAKFGADAEAVSPDAIFALCNALAQRYDFVHADMPHQISSWSAEIIRNSDASVIAATCDVPSALRVAALVRRLGDQKVQTDSLLIAINKYVGGFFNKGLPGADFERAIPDLARFYIPRDEAHAAEAANVGRPMMSAASRKPVAKGIAALGKGLQSRRDQKVSLDKGERPKASRKSWLKGATS